SLGSGPGNAGLGPIARFLSWLTGEHPVARKDSAAAAGAAPGTVGARLPETVATAGRSHPALVDIPRGQGWRATINFTQSHPRPPHGANVIAVDPRATCDVFREANPVQYDLCIRQLSPSSTDYSQSTTTGGGPVFRFPASSSVTGNMTFNLTENWAASWQTSFDLVRHEFASQIVSLQRELKDWKAMFGFQQAPNGNFAFNFLITLKPAPDVQFPYNQRTYHGR
ncbi:MAG TPA: hypothetical protein VE967_18825, partial [Gemmatimonadaceae bacterium]|nr:hypothetical protein [Gemmatimonadaceae bacterium]